ncbi:hypothetical protein Syun_021805 [Stephania yunnanensis]|uniref:Uncharacterized protein n=1 Tax=Stephania yunnanensis TaxID=152371 RepID=A0AAP0IHA4_9MAGN
MLRRKGAASNIFVENHDPSFTADRAGYHSIDQQHNASPFRPRELDCFGGRAALSDARWRQTALSSERRRESEIRDGGAGESGGWRERRARARCEMVATTDCSGGRGRRWRRRDGADSETA